MEPNDDILDAARALAFMFGELLVHLTKTDGLERRQVVEIVLANEVFISNLPQNEGRKALLYQAVHREVCGRIAENPYLFQHVERERQRRQSRASG